MATHYASGADFVSTFANGITETLLLNNRLQDMQITVNNPATHGTLSDSGYCYNSSCGSTGSNNGNVSSIADQLNSSRTQTFTYDQLNRLTSAQTSGTQWGNTYVMDAWGNLLQKNQMAGKASGENLLITVDGSNRLNGGGYIYDSSGNMTYDSIHHYAFDAENQVKTVDGNPDGSALATYIAGPDGQRAQAGGRRHHRLHPLQRRDPGGMEYSQWGQRLERLHLRRRQAYRPRR